MQYGTNDLRRIALDETGQATVLRILYAGTTSELQAKRFNIRWGVLHKGCPLMPLGDLLPTCATRPCFYSYYSKMIDKNGQSF